MISNEEAKVLKVRSTPLGKDYQRLLVKLMESEREAWRLVDELSVVLNEKPEVAKDKDLQKLEEAKEALRIISEREFFLGSADVTMKMIATNALMKINE